MKIKRIFFLGALACMFCCFPGCQDSDDVGAVSYTHLTLPTILLV